jgi:hypothetical protein
MFQFFRRAPLQLFIDHDQVYCPVRGKDTDTEVCAACPSLTKIDEAARPPFLRCRPEPVRSITPMWG